MRFYKLSAVFAAFLICLLAGCQSPQESPDASATPKATATASPTEKPEPSAEPEATPTPAPTESSEPQSSKGSASNSCFENSAFVGNSMLEDLNMFGIIDNANFYAKTGLTVTSAFKEKTADGTAPIMDEVLAGNYEKVFLMFGLNELGWSYSDVFVQDYGKIIDTLRQANSDVKIYVQSLFPVSKERSDKNLYGVTNERIVDYNNMLKKLCDEKGVKYIDVYSAMVTEDGVLEDGASPDGVHPNMQYCETWVQYLRDHC